MRYVLTAQDYQFINSPTGESLRALSLSVPTSVWESLDSINTQFETEVNEATVSFQAMVLESFDSFMEIGKNQTALFRAAIDDIKLQTKEEYDQAVKEAYAVYEGLWDAATGLLKALTEGGTAIGILHLILDLIGLIPGSWFGFPVDVVANVLNAVIYGFREMWFLAVLSLIAAIPANYVFKGLKLALTPFAKILNKLGFAIFKADTAAIKLASSELKVAAGVEKSSMLANALGGFVQFMQNTLLAIVKALGATLETILNKVTLGLVPKGKMVKFIQEHLEVPLTKAVRGSEEAIIALKQGDDALLQATTADIKTTAKKLTQAEQDALISKFGKLATGDGDAVIKVTNSQYYKQMIEAGAPPAALEAYVNAALARISFDKAFKTTEKIMADPKAVQVLRKAGWKGEQSAITRAINSGDADTIAKVFKEVTENPAILKGLSEGEATVLRIYSKYPKEFIKHGKNFDAYLTTLTRLTGKFAYREKIGRKLLMFIFRQIAKVIMSDPCYKQYASELASVKSAEELKAFGAKQLINEAETIDRNSKQYREIRAEIVKLYKLEETPEADREIHAMTIEAITKANEKMDDCGASAEVTKVLAGESYNPGLGGQGNEYGQKEITDKDFEKIEDVIASQLRLAGLDDKILPVNDLANSDPMIKLYYADFYEPASERIYINTEQTNVYNLGNKLVKTGEIKQSDLDAKVKAILKHWEDGTEPEQVSKMLSDTTTFNESTGINNSVKFLRFDSFKNSLK
jgi:hypothetical protein